MVRELLEGPWVILPYAVKKRMEGIQGRLARVPEAISPEKNSISTMNTPILPFYRFMCLPRAQVRSGCNKAYFWADGVVFLSPTIVRYKSLRISLRDGPGSGALINGVKNSGK